MRSIAFLLATLLPLAACAAWVDGNGKPLPDTESKRSAGELGVMILLTDDEPQLRRTWSSSKTPPSPSSTESTRPGSSVSAVLVFHGCAANAREVCDLEADFFVEGPGGRRASAGAGKPVWSHRPMAPGVLQLGQASLNLAFDSTDPLGDYKIIAKVKDKVANRELTVQARLKLQKK